MFELGMFELENWRMFELGMFELENWGMLESRDCKMVFIQTFKHSGIQTLKHSQLI